jgi:hypothetical protein
MALADRARGAVSLQSAVGALGRQLAVFIGAFVALASLLAHAPVSVASMRGAAATLALIGLTRVGEWLSARTATPPRTKDEGKEPSVRPEYRQ